MRHRKDTRAIVVKSLDFLISTLPSKRLHNLLNKNLSNFDCTEVSTSVSSAVKVLTVLNNRDDFEGKCFHSNACRNEYARSSEGIYLYKDRTLITLNGSSGVNEETIIMTFQKNRRARRKTAE